MSALLAVQDQPAPRQPRLGDVYLVLVGPDTKRTRWARAVVVRDARWIGYYDSYAQHASHTPVRYGPWDFMLLADDGDVYSIDRMGGARFCIAGGSRALDEQIARDPARIEKRVAKMPPIPDVMRCLRYVATI